MTRAALGLLLSLSALQAEDVNPIVRAWRVNPQGTNASAELKRVLPDVHSVRWNEHYAYIESAGIALQSLGPLEVNAVEGLDGLRRFVYRFPLAPKFAEGDAVKTPIGVVGAFINGVPIYNFTAYASYGDQNLWHLDAVATALRVAPPPPLLQSLLNAQQKHSPLIGYALDGYPIYGPYGWAPDGSVRRFRSSYKLRAMTKRDTLPDGTRLTPAQEGPPMTGAFPLGAFVEDYEYVPSAGDLDAHNGRWTKTPEYPNGTYAYFLSTDTGNRLLYPYLVGPSFAGRITTAELRNAAHADRPLPVAEPVISVSEGRVTLTIPSRLEAGKSAGLSFVIHNAAGQPVRFPERVHEKPLHLAVISDDLADFAHIHPELQPDDSFLVDHIFPHGGRWWLYADITAPGEAQKITRFPVDVTGTAGVTAAPVSEAIEVTMKAPERLETGVDLPFHFSMREVGTGRAVTDLQPYLGAWAHIMVVSKTHTEFLHVHPLDDPTSSTANQDPLQHTHAVAGPSPSTVDAVTGFAEPGTYKLWIQVQRQGKVITVPFTLTVQPGKRITSSSPVTDAIHISVSRNGYEPSQVTIPAGKPARLAFERKDAANCAGTVLFPDLGIRKELPPGETTIVELPASNARELKFSCGMKMYRGAVLVQ